MNNAGTVLLTLADMGVIQAEVEVDETNVPNVQIGQRAKITIDAIPDKSFRGHVTEIGNSPIQAAGTTTTTQATNFKVTLTVDGEIPEVRPGFTCTAEITTATRDNVLSVPIQSLTVREMVVDNGGNIVRESVDPKVTRPRRGAPQSDLKPGQSRKELEGVFLVREGRAEFHHVTSGIAGEKYFEVLSGLKEGDQVIVGPFNSVREIADGAAVKVEAAPQRRTPGTKS
jgi:HlyD family secretion protein